MYMESLLHSTREKAGASTFAAPKKETDADADGCLARCFAIKALLYILVLFIWVG